MKLKKARLLAFLLVPALLLSGCSFRVLENVYRLLVDIEATPYSEIVYTRPDLDALQAQFEDMQQLARESSNESEINEALDACWDAYNRFYTQQTLAMLHADADLTDEYWQEEYDFCREAAVQVDQWMDETLTDCAESGLADPTMLAGYEAGEGYGYSDKTVALLEQENALIAEYYDTLYGLKTVDIDGETVDLESYINRTDLSDEAYQAAMQAYDEACLEAAAPIYVDLIRTRQALAAELDYDSYEQFQYDSYGRDFTPEQAQDYLQGVAKTLSPWVAEIMAQDPYSQVTYGPMSERELMDILGKAVNGLDGWSGEAFTQMLENDLYDATYSVNKSSQSYTTYLAAYSEPFCFIGTYGDEEDLLTFAHEFGHYVDSYANYNATTNLDLMEVYSMSMENLVMARLKNILDDDTYRNLLQIHVLSILDVYSSQAFYAAFESAAYALPEDQLTPEGLQTLATELAAQYGAPELAGYWAQVSHLFEYPFYVVSYCVAQDVSLQLWQMELEETGAGSACFDDFVYWEEDALMLELERVELTSPFAPDRLVQIHDFLQDQLEISTGNK